MKYCRECKHSGYCGTHCYKEYVTTFIDGCEKCGKMVNAKCYELEEDCPDFDARYYDDPSGS